EVCRQGRSLSTHSCGRRVPLHRQRSFSRDRKESHQRVSSRSRLMSPTTLSRSGLRTPGVRRRIRRRRGTQCWPRLPPLEDPPLRARSLVTSDGDSGPGTLRSSIAAAGAGDTIMFSNDLIGHTIVLTTGELVINDSLNIIGPGSNRLAVSASL